MIQKIKQTLIIMVLVIVILFQFIMILYYFKTRVSGHLNRTDKIDTINNKFVSC